MYSMLPSRRLVRYVEHITQPRPVRYETHITLVLFAINVLHDVKLYLVLPISSPPIPRLQHPAYKKPSSPVSRPVHVCVLVNLASR